MSDFLAKVQLQITYFVVFELNFENYYLWHANAFLCSGLSIVQYSIQDPNLHVLIVED